jgi:hypothetical protein
LKYKGVQILAAILLALLQGMGRPVAAAERPQRQAPILLPLTFIRQNAFTAITVDGQTISADVDTGGVGDASLALSKAVIQRVGATRLPGMVVSTDTFGRSLLRPRFRVHTVGIGGRSFRNMTVMEVAAPAASNRPGPPNGIGRRFLSRYFVVLDFPHRSITLWPPEASGAARTGCGHAAIPMEPGAERGLAVSVFQTQYGRIRLLFDTGATYSMLPETLAARLRLPTITRGAGSPPFYESAVLSAGGHDFGPLEFVILPLVPPGDFQGMLGWNFFMHHVVCLDYRRREVFIH